MNVVLLHDDVPPDARPDELDVFDQIRAIETALSELGHSHSTLPLSLDLSRAASALREIGPDLVFNLSEAVEGSGRLTALPTSLLDMLCIPYTGAGTTAMLLTTNKLATKKWLAAAGIATPAWCSWDQTAPGHFAAGRFIVKSVWEEASVGLNDASIVEVSSEGELKHAIDTRAADLGGEGFAEAYVEGREFNLSVLAGPHGPEVLPPAEIRFEEWPTHKPRIVGYAAKWDTQTHEYHHTPRTFEIEARDQGMVGHLMEIARQCWKLFELRGYARVDFRVDSAGRPWVLEINANPCLSPDAGFQAAARQAGLPFTEVVRRIIADAGAVDSFG